MKEGAALRREPRVSINTRGRDVFTRVPAQGVVGGPFDDLVVRKSLEPNAVRSAMPTALGSHAPSDAPRPSYDSRRRVFARTQQSTVDEGQEALIAWGGETVFKYEEENTEGFR